MKSEQYFMANKVATFVKTEMNTPDLLAWAIIT